MGGDDNEGPTEFRRILVTTDFSDGSQTAASLGIHLAADDANVHVLHARPNADSHLPLLMPSKWELRKLKKQAEKREEEVRKRLDEFAERLGRRNTTSEVRRGSVAHTLTEAMETFDPDLVTVGARGLADRKGEEAGSTTRSVIRSSHASILVGRGALPKWDKRRLRIGVATDLHETSRHAGQVAAVLAKRLNAELHVVHIADAKLWIDILSESIHGEDDGEEMTWSHIQDRVRKSLHGFNVDVLGGQAEEVLLTGNPRAELGEAAERLDLDLLVLGTQGPRTAGTVRLGSVAVETAATAPASVLLVQ